MLQTNLATKPFYNERAVHWWLLVVAAAVAAATVFNVYQVVHYSRSDTELKMQAGRDEERAADLRAAAARLRATVDARQVELASAEARQANTLIDRRTFSWTELFNSFETTLPPPVRITSVRHRLENQRIVLTITVVARGVDDVYEFMERLESTGTFGRLLSPEEHVNEEGQLEAVIETVYVPRPSTGAAGKPQ